MRSTMNKYDINKLHYHTNKIRYILSKSGYHLDNIQIHHESDQYNCEDALLMVPDETLQRVKN